MDLRLVLLNACAVYLVSMHVFILTVKLEEVVSKT